MQEKALLCLSPQGFHKLAYVEWGEQNAQQTIICVHGLTRNGRDFDYLARDLCSRARVVCPDLPGRGKSARFNNPHFYAQAQYVADLAALIARLDVNSVTWIGTSLGGILGMYLAAQANSPIKALILNDVGPLIPRAGLLRIGKYAHHEQVFKNLAEAENYFRTVYKDCELLTDEMWREKTRHSVMQLPDQTFVVAYDPKVAAGMHKFWITDVNLWHLWSQIHCPVLVLRGEKSDILLKQTAEQMRTTGPKATVHEVPGCGHAPLLLTQDQITVVDQWLNQHNLIAK